MRGGQNLMTPKCSSLLITISILLLASVSAGDNNTSPSPSPAPAPSGYTPPDNYLLNCGSPRDTKLDDGRTFKSDSATMAYLQTNQDVTVSVDSIPSDTLLSGSAASPSSLPLFRSARIFTSVSKFTLPITKPGWHWLRLYLYLLPNPHCNPSTAVFSVATATSLLLHDFSIKDHSPPVFKEYLLDVATEQLAVFFNPRTSCAFVNALEVVSVPDGLIFDEASPVPTVSGGTAFKGVSKFAFQVSYRLNVGGPIVTPADDALSRTWMIDTPYNAFAEGARNVSVSPKSIKFPDSVTPYIAPSLVYATADEMADSRTQTQNFNLTWKLPADAGFSYLIRLHFCDIVSKSLDSLYFNVYINGFATADSPVDLSSIDRALSTAYYKDFVASAGTISNDSVMLQVGPDTQMQSGQINAILNGIEVMKMSRIDGSLDGIAGIGGLMSGGALKVIAGIGLGIAVTGLLLLGVIMLRWHNRPKGWEKRRSFSSWLLPLHGSTQFSVSSSSNNSSRKSSTSFFGSKKSKSYSSPHLSNSGLGRYFSFAELQTATQNFDEAAILGVGGFGKVYLGVLEDGTKVAIKRGIPGSEQGINEFQTEIQMLSKLRHRHLVSLIGFSDEQSEMILVYEYMANGPLRDHLYGKAKQGTLSWKQRLEICIGSARGLHYLHTGASEAIIHRDVKTTNILLDEKLVAKVADFGLSKAAPMDRGPVSTAVKGSFGYLDPEYFRRQQLTDKSDVYSFGVLLFEVLCARPVICPTLPREQVNLGEWAMRCYKKGTLDGIIDKEIKESISSESLKKFVEAAEKCLAEYGVDRPAMGDVLWNLEYALQLQDAAGSAASSAMVSGSSADPADERSTANLIALEGGDGKGKEGGDDDDDDDDDDEKKKGECSVDVGGTDDSQVIGSSTIMSHFGNVQGR